MLSNITVIGNGAIGTLWAFHLARHGYCVTLVGRKQRAQNRALTFHAYDGEVIEQSIDYLTNKLPEKNDLVLVVTKAYQVVNALTPYLETLAHCPIVLMHNGLGAAQHLPLTNQHSVFVATTSHGALMQDGNCRHTGLGETMIGCFANASETQGLAISQLLNDALTPVKYVADIDAALWRKLAINCAINPLTALNDCRNGELAYPKYTQQLDTIVEEISQLTTALNLGLSYQSLRNTVNDVIEKTALNFSSMHQDVTHHRVTEVDYINGYIVQQGKALGITTPENDKLWKAINAL